MSRIIFSIWSSQKILHGDSCFIVNLLFHHKLGWKTFEHIFDYGTCKMKPSSIFWKLNTFVMLSSQERIPHCNSSHSHVLSLVVLSIVADFIPLICFKDRLYTKKWMPGYIFLDIFDCRRGKYQISKILWNSKISMMFKPSFCCHLYKSIQLLSLDKTLLGNFKCKIKICTAKLIHFIYINTALYVTLIISGKN